MEQTNTRRGFTQRHPLILDLIQDLVVQVFKAVRFQIKFGMTVLYRGFTLIELLVVVLIIGILAAVAVPQYQRAVKKTRLTEYFLYLDSLYKGIDIWLLTNGIPEKTQYFTGETPTMTLDIDMPFTKAVGKHSYTKFGRLNGACDRTTCWIDLGTAYDDYSGFLEKGAKIYTTRFLDSDTGKIILTEVPNNTQDRKLVCDWWDTHYGKEQMEDTVKTKCADVGI